MFDPAETGSGESLLPTTRSANGVGAETVVAAVALLLAVDDSALDVATLAVFVMIVPADVPAFTVTTRVNDAVAPAASDGFVAETVPVAPTAGALGTQPAGAVKEENVVFAGSVSVSNTFAAAA